MKGSERICELNGCNNLIISKKKSARTCSNDCGYALRSEEFKGGNRGDGNPLNSSSNELIRMINKFLLVKPRGIYESV
ncbi:MAG: hypothetical protein JKX72_02485 [Robiginitomaculum sp.]|nr:hypothetical protein [Robiginitomaculum sp.]